MSNVEVHIDLDGVTHSVGLLRRNAGRAGSSRAAGSGRHTETVTFEYDAAWLRHPSSFSLEPSLGLTRGVFAPANGQSIFGSIGDSAPDTWGRRLMQRSERRQAMLEGRNVKALSAVDYLLGVSDETRLGALRFRWTGEKAFQAPARTGVPSLIELGRLLQITRRILRDEETDEDLQMIFAPGSSLGGARPKASVVDQHGHLSIAKFPKEADEYSLETWEEIALLLAEKAGIAVPRHRLVEVAGQPVLLSQRFDRYEGRRVAFLSAMAMTGSVDGETGSYPELVDAITRHGSKAKADAEELYRRMVFNILISNVDDHLRNHGFLWQGRNGWCLSPAYDLNPTPADLKARILTTNISLDEGTCSLDLAESVAGYFGLKLIDARAIIKSVGSAVAGWRTVASKAGARPAEINRMASAFEHDDLERTKVM